jgi:hypothetical protein
MTAPATPPEMPRSEKPPRSRGRSIRMMLRVIQVRLRFFIVLIAAFLVVGKWDVLRNYWDRIIHAASGADPALQAISNDTEYFCPMDPGVVSDWPGKCPICNMGLVRRKRGDATPLPDGVVARMQLSPYRVQLAGIQTSPVAYRPLERVVEAVGFVEGEGEDRARVRVVAEVFEKDVPLLEEGQSAEIVCEALPGLGPFLGTLESVRPLRAPSTGGGQAVIGIEKPEPKLRSGMAVVARIKVPIARIEPFRSLPMDPPPLAKGEPRTVWTCTEHREVLRDRAGRCPVDRNPLEHRTLSENQRLRWWCLRHPDVTADRPGRTCEACGGMTLVPRIITYQPAGQVLAVPESAVVDTGTRTVVYVESGPGMFEGIEVVLGPRCGSFYPVARGLEAGQRVATTGAFLIDAETHLNPSLAAAYFGAASSASAGADRSPPNSTSSTSIDRDFSALSAGDRALALQQEKCPVTGKPLGSMGSPVAVVIEGRKVFLCCAGCAGKLKHDPKKYLPQR